MDPKNKHRIFLSVFFFLSGFSFSSWASRIPSIKTTFDLNEAELGTILLTMPISSLIGLPISGWLVTRFDSRIPMAVAFIVQAIALFFIGFAQNTFELVAAVCVFAFSMRILNIAMNTQAITLQKQFPNKINGAFHGLWSTGGIAGVSFTTLMLAFNIPMVQHLLLVSLFTLIINIFSYRHLLSDDRSTSGNKLIFGKPDPYILYLGVLVFFAAVCEGGMFDWSGIFFKEVVHVEIFTAGYLIFMTFMALSRFLSDKIIEHIGMPTTYVLSGLLIASGIFLAVFLPYFWPAMIGFSLVGLGTAAIIPMTYLLAGESKKYSAGMAISIIATYGMVGMLIGPPMIGYIAHALDLRISFVIFAFAGLMFLPISKLFFQIKQCQ
ncbi:MAG: MFS transporter [Bacteroidota bacterium]|nr:MFS transporter [Bacteroidota bacterium]